MPQPARRPSRPAAAQTPVPGAVVVATDGSCKPNPGPAGWAWYVDDSCWQAGAMARETNQVAELVAVAAALRVLPVGVALHIRSDSQYAINSATAWVPKWKANGWRSSTGQPVMNLGWVQEIDRALTDRRAPTT